MWRLVLYGFTAIISAATINTLLRLDLADFFLGLFMSAGLIYWSIRVYKKSQRSSVKTSQPSAVTPEVRERYKKSAIRAKQAERNEEQYRPIQQAAIRLREVANRFEDQRYSEVFVAKNIQVERITKSQRTLGPGAFVVTRGGVVIQYGNWNSKTKQIRTVEKKWPQVIGVTPNQFELYLQDHSGFEFHPNDLEEFIYLSAFWQVFNTELNGFPKGIINPTGSPLGEQLRRVAAYLEENRATVLAKNGGFDIEDIDLYVPKQKQTKSQPITQPTTGDVLGGYRLGEMLGEGGFGIVYKARQVGGDRQVAVKVMSAKQMKAEPGSVDFFRRASDFLLEAEKSLNFAFSAFVITAEEYSQDPWPWIRFPLFEGQTVTKLFRSGSEVDSFWWDLAHDLISGLDSIHKEGIVHLDIKPDNLIYGDNKFVILDLGISQIEGYELTEGVGGTWPFMSPEMLKMYLPNPPKEKPSQPADIFSAGLALLWCLRRDYHFPGLTNRTETIELLDSLSQISTSLAGLPTDKAQLLTKMLALNPNERASASELLFLVAPHVDIDSKIRMMQQVVRQQDQMAAEELEKGEKIKQTRKIDGPFSSWKEFNGLLEELVDTIRPAFFSVDIDFKDGREGVYVQALRIPDEWVLECMSDQFSDQKFTTQQINNFLRLGWNPPTDSSPNFEKTMNLASPKEMADLFILAIEQAYGFKVTDVSKFEAKIQNRGAY